MTTGRDDLAAAEPQMTNPSEVMLRGTPDSLRSGQVDTELRAVADEEPAGTAVLCSDQQLRVLRWRGDYGVDRRRGTGAMRRGGVHLDQGHMLSNAERATLTLASRGPWRPGRPQRRPSRLR